MLLTWQQQQLAVFKAVQATQSFKAQAAQQKRQQHPDAAAAVGQQQSGGSGLEAAAAAAAADFTRQQDLEGLEVGVTTLSQLFSFPAGPSASMLPLF